MIDTSEMDFDQVLHRAYDIIGELRKSDLLALNDSVLHDNAT